MENRRFGVLLVGNTRAAIGVATKGFFVFRTLRAKVALGATVVVAAAGAMLALTLPTGAGAVAGGEAAADGQFPFAVKFLMTDIPKADGTTYDSACSGALIDEQWVITAGHCFHDVDRVPVSGPVPYKTTAIIGRTDDENTDEGHEIQVTEVRQSSVNDVSLAKLAEPVTDVKPLKLRSTAPEVGETLTLAGWGGASADTTVPATHLQIGQMTVHSVEDVTATVTGLWPRADTSACPTDSGAPYFNDGELVSLESDGPACPHSQPETTSRVDVIADWIEEQISQD